jgi:phosphate transport system substrate-binding protein
MAEGLENIITRCPCCGGRYTFRTKGKKLFCESCGLACEINSRYRFSTEAPFETFADWYDWQIRKMREDILADPNFMLSSNVVLKHASKSGKKQLEYAKEKGVELELTPIGYEAFVFFVNSKNPIDEVSLEDIKEIYSGKITKWNELGVSGFGKIRAFQREEGSGSQSALLRLMEGKELMIPPKEDVVWGMGEIIKQTANYKNFKNALGFSFRFYSTEMVKNSQIKLLKINGVAPTRENIENGTYPITSNFYAVTRKGDTSENTKKLIDWILSNEGKEIIDKTGYTPIK